MTKDHKIETCGLCCEICDGNTTKIIDSANYLVKIFEDPMFSGVISMFNSKFKQENVPIFKQMLEIVSSFPPCPGCEGRTDCVINLCASEKGIKTCGQCEFLDFKSGKCIAPLTPPREPMMPPAPIFFNGLAQRYRRWNIKNLEAITKGKKDDINSFIDNMIKEGKTNRELIDFSVNLFDSKP